MLFISLILVAVSMLWDRDVTAKMDAIIEEGEVPMAYRLHLLHDWLSIVQTLTFWGFLVPLYSWSKDQKAAWAKMTAEKAKNPPAGDFGKEGNTMGLLGKLFKRKDSKDIMEKPQIPKVQTAEDSPLTRWETYGRGEPVVARHVANTTCADKTEPPPDMPSRQKKRYKSESKQSNNCGILL